MLVVHSRRDMIRPNEHETVRTVLGPIGAVFHFGHTQFFDYKLKQNDYHETLHKKTIE